jgi:hypothetical protein
MSNIEQNSMPDNSQGDISHNPVRLQSRRASTQRFYSDENPDQRRFLGTIEL